jgi:hypothetical protein
MVPSFGALYPPFGRPNASVLTQVHVGFGSASSLSWHHQPDSALEGWRVPSSFAPKRVAPATVLTVLSSAAAAMNVAMATPRRPLTCRSPSSA